MTRFSPKVTGLIAGVCALCLGSCDDYGREAAPQKAADILLVTIDTLRADALGLYGYGRPTSPNLDAFAEGAVVFDAAQAPTSWTLSSLSSLLTGHYAWTTGIRDFRSQLDDRFVTLAEHLRARNYDTAAVGTHVVFQDKYGLRQGFARFDDELVEADYQASHKAITSELVSDKGLEFLSNWSAARAAGEERPWLLWLHYFDPHIPYRRHAEFPFGDSGRDRYDAEVAFTDKHLGRVLDALGENGFEDAVICVVSDHGEEFGDHGGREHGHSLYTELVRVPLILRAPGFEPARISQAVGVIDVLPTLLELSGAGGSPQALGVDSISGRSLVPLMAGADSEDWDARPLLGELRLRRDTEMESLRSGPWKLIRDRDGQRLRLYNVQRDPAEQRDLAAREVNRTREMNAELERQIQAARELGSGAGAEARLELDQEEEAALRALGYLGEEDEAAND